MDKLIKYLDERAAILQRRVNDPNCIDRDQQQARLAEITAVMARVSVLIELDNDAR